MVGKFPQSRQVNAIARGPGHALDVALKNLALATERNHLSSQFAAVAALDGDQQRSHHSGAELMGAHAG